MTAELSLRDIHLAPAPSWWPPAPGWWILAALAALLGVWMLHRWFVLVRHRRAVRRRLALLDASLAAAGALPTHRVAVAATCLRQVALHEAPHGARLQGEDWLAYLDRGMRGAPFVGGPGRLLLDGPYRPEVDAQAADALLSVVRERLRRGLP